ncbi:glycosyltransferase family 2 protein [Methanosarcina sp. Mfa9]|uniref:glycosyltransferase family 2 protein n=1 Tax=Methanosarcina sp. Mfa9 TaxID=3439063 RepID=UPI003F8516AC
MRDENIRSKQKRYVITTPVKNEERYLPKLIESIINQTVKPLLWIIVDDNSTDQTPDIIREATETNEWIQSIQLKEGTRDRGVHLANVIRIGFDFAYTFCNENKMDFDYIGNVDADQVFKDTYFEKLIEKFENDGKLGVASGSEWWMNGKKTVYLKGRYPSGGNVLYRKECYEDCDGIPISKVWDSVMNTKAVLRGWSINRFDDSKVFLIRGYSYADGLWKGYKSFGESAYIINYNPLYALTKGLKLLFIKPHYIGLAYIYGYLSSLILRKKQIDDKEVKHYFQHIRPQEARLYYIKMLRTKLKGDTNN